MRPHAKSKVQQTVTSTTSEVYVIVNVKRHELLIDISRSLRVYPTTPTVVAGVNTVLTPTVTQKREKLELWPSVHRGLLQR